MQVSITVQGIAEAARKLENVKNGVRRRVLRRANVAAARPIRATAKKASVFIDRSGLLRRSLVLKTKTYPSGTVVSVIGADRNVQGTYKGRRRVPANYLHLVETGHRIAVSERTQASMADTVLLRRGKRFLRAGQTQAVVAGMVRARPFIGPAGEQNVSASLAKFRETFARGAEMEASR
jgi:HK97 gp10 family phage protein